MAEQLASAAMGMILTTLRDATVREIRLYRNFQTDLDNLESKFKSIQWVLQDAEIKQWKDGSIRDWLRKLKDASYEVEDILDEVATEGLRRKVEFLRGNNSISCFSLSYPLRFRFKIAHKMKVMREKLSQIEKEKDAFHFTRSEDSDVGVRYGVTKEDRETTSLVDESEIYGRRVEKEMIVAKLLDKGLEQDDLYVYVICGMGGLGKTTLAQLMYNDERTQNHFDVRIWVCVSNDFNKIRLVQAMIGSLDNCKCDISELEQLQRRLREKLNGKRFLFVLDDVWNENEREWEELRIILACGVNGSVVMVTTRNEKIANMMVSNNLNHESCNHICQIEKLSHEVSMSLFKRRALPSGEMEDKLVSIGEAIVKKCDGVPLAIKALGGLMKDKSGEREWLAIEKSEIWNLADNGILPSLRLSYFNLPHDMRQCFAYCCIFRKDEEMEVDRLIQLWMANGFVVPSDGLKDLPLIGQNIFKELTCRSFFQDIGTNWAGKKICKMHDLMHDLAVSIMGHETNTEGQNSESEIRKGLRHAIDKTYTQEALVSRGTSSFRTFIFDHRNYPELSKDLCSFLSKQQYLRALEMGHCSIINLDLGCKFKHLMFLVMSCQGMKTLPKSLTRLCNLQTLKLMHSKQLLELPKDLKAMEKLCFLEMDRFDSLGSMPPDLGKLNSLCRLSVFIVGEDAPQRIGQLKELNLGGELTIIELENVKSSEDAKSAKLRSKMDLTSLALYWKQPQNMEQDRREDQEHFGEVLVGLQPHENIEEVFINDYPGSKFPEWMSSSDYKKLKKIEVVSCTNCEHLPPLGKLPSLTRLKIDGMDSVNGLGVEWHGDGDCSFPKLKKLEIQNMPNLEEWCTPDSVECFPCLTELEIRNCPNLEEWSTPDSVECFPCLTKLRIGNCPKLASLPALQHLKSLSLKYNGKVDTLPKDLLQNNKALQILTICAPSIKSVSNMLDNLSSLKSLAFNVCYNLEVIPESLSCLHSLEILQFYFCNSLETFPVTILEGVPSLRILKFDHCERLELFPGPMKVVESALQELYILGLPKLQCIPESLACLNSLRKLYISSSSPQLKKRCRELNGEDWPKISHIPTIEIY